MNLDNEYNIAARYRSIRKHLDSLGYRQALALDALPLIEKLLSDLIRTTDSLKHFKAVAHENIETCNRLRLTVDPYKCDNARLVQECNQLHLDLTEAKETHQVQIKELKRKVNNLESECGDLQSGSSRNLKRIKELEAESGQKSKRIQELLGKCNKPIINNLALGLKKRPCYPPRRPSLEAEPMPGSKTISGLPSRSKVEPRVVNLIEMADCKISALSHEVTGLKGELSLHIDTVYTLKSQLATKEKEISRLRLMLEGGRPYSAVSKDCSCEKIGQCCDHDAGYEKTLDDDDESEIVEKSKFDVEKELKEALKKQHEAMSQAMKLAERNEELEKELRDIDHIALAVEADCNSVVKENNKRVSQLQEKLSSVMTQVHVLESELMVERRSGQELRADLEGARLDNRNLQRKLESSLDEKKQMTDRINRLTVIEKNLNEESERAARNIGNLKEKIVRLDCANSLLKKQMISKEISENVNQDLEKIKEKGSKNDRNKGKMSMKKKAVSRGQRRSFSPPIVDKQTETDDEPTRDSNVDATRNASRKLDIEEEAKIISQLRQTLDQIQGDRDFYKKQYNRLREQCTKNSEVDNAELWGQVCELRRQLIDKEHAILELQKEKKEVCREKLELELRLQSTRLEKRNAGNPCGECRPIGNCGCSIPAPLAGGDSSASSALVERLERERDTARTDVDRLVEERDTLRERLKLAVESHKNEQRRLRESLCDVETRLKKLERERQDLLIAQGMQRATIDGHDDQLEHLREELRRTKQELSSQRTQYFQLRTLQDQADQALGDVQGQLNNSEAELYKAMDRNRILEQRRSQLDDQVKELKQEINGLCANRNHMDEEKDRLTMELEEKSGKIEALEREIKAKEQETLSVEQRLQELHHKNELCVDQSAEQERRLRNMQMEMEIHQRQLAAASTDRDNATQENRRLQDDLAAVTCEIRTLQRELEVSRAESYDLKRQLQTYVTEVRRAEDLINKKENERTEMLNHFRSLSLEATMLENNNHSLESDAAEARGALQAAQDRTMDLERQLADRDCLVGGYETQISELTQTVASLETEIRQQIDQRQRAEADLNAVRDLCVKLDRQKESLVKELGDKAAMKAQYEAQISRLKTDRNMVQDQINRDHVTVERLESLLDQARQESMDSQTAKQELQCEMSRLKQRTCELQNKLSAESAELRRYQNQAAEYSKQIAELRRQVTNERFDRARKEEEHRRYPQTEKPGEYRNRDNRKFEAQRTNRFNTSVKRGGKASTITICKCSASEIKISNDEQKNSDVSAMKKSSIIGETVEREQVAPSKSGGLCVRATLEEDDKHKDIRVRISDASVFQNLNDNNEKMGIVKLCPSVARGESANRLSIQKYPVSSRTTTDGGGGTTMTMETKSTRLPISPSNDGDAKLVPTNNVDQRTAEKYCLESKISNSDYGNEDEDERSADERANENSTVLSDDKRDIEEIRSKSHSGDEIYLSRSNASSVRIGRCVDVAPPKPDDVTRPEFVRWLTEIKEKTKNVERQLARINGTLTNQSRLVDDVSSKPTEIKSVASDKTTSTKKTKRIRKKDGWSQSEFTNVVGDSSTPKTTNKIVMGKTQQRNVEFMENIESYGGKSPPRLVHVDESTMFKPSKIHKFKKQASPVDNPEKITRLDCSAVDFSARSQIPTRRNSDIPKFPSFSTCSDDYSENRRDRHPFDSCSNRETARSSIGKNRSNGTPESRRDLISLNDHGRDTSKRDARSKSVSPHGRLDKIVGRSFERHNDQPNDRRVRSVDETTRFLSNNEQRATSYTGSRPSSPSVPPRSRKLYTERQISLTNYGSSLDSRLDRRNVRYFAHENSKISDPRQRSKSDPRDNAASVRDYR